MPHLSGVFDQFPDLEKVPIEQITAWISEKFEVHFIVNYLGNRVLYPQAIPLTRKELEIDLAILRAAIRLKPGLFFQPQTNRIIIPKMFIERFPNAGDLVRAIIEGINPKGVHLIYIKTETQVRMIGSVISPLNPQKLSHDERTVIFATSKTKKALPLNQISIIPASTSETKVMLGSEEYKALGGEVGIIIDLRLGGFAQ